VAADNKDRVYGFLKRRAFNFLQSSGNTKLSVIFGESFPKYLILNPEGAIRTTRGTLTFPPLLSGSIHMT
jgi:hypothetical protein